MKKSSDVSVNSSPASVQQNGATFALLLATTIFLSAFLLFQVQPLISKFILPWFGGSPAVWTTAMLFFQSVLFCGYAYAHGVSHFLSIRAQALLHTLLLIAAAVAATLIIPSERLKPNGDEDPALRILLLLLVCVGLPYFTLATTGPLIQAWFSRAFPGRSPYRLYSLSNVGSFLALLTFPYIFEPVFELPRLGWFWTVGFWLFAGMAALVAINMFRLAPPAPHALESSEPDAALERIHPAWWHRAAWVALPALASLAFIATTDHVSHDVAPEPRLWITTLSLYLLTFIICFDHERWYRRGWIAGACLIGIVLLSCRSEILDRLSIDFELGLTGDRWFHFIVMLLVCLMCHGELVRLRPKAHRYLTEFYLWMSLGGACGGLFVTLVATNFFADYYEWSLMLLLSLTVATVVLLREIQHRSDWQPSRIRAVEMIGATICLVLAGFVAYCEDPFDWRSYEGTDYKVREISQRRNFYGSIGVIEWTHVTDPRESFRTFFSGVIKHGTQFTDVSRRRDATSYYSPGSGLGETIAYAQQKLPSMRLAVVGLGVGTIATYARPEDHYDFFEINPQVIPVAQNEFWYLQDCRAGSHNIILGDARLKLEELPESTQYDMIVLDAFSGDSVPVHLLTREAFEIYMKHLKPEGFLVVHITNSHLNLYPVVKRQAEHLGLGFRNKYLPSDSDQLIQRSHYFIMTRDEAYLRRYPSVNEPMEDDAGKKIGELDPNRPNVPLWSDHFSSINAIEEEN